MILFLILLDILVYNYTSYKSFFFLISLNLIKPNDYLKVILIGFFLDFILLNQSFINTICLLLLFVLNKKIFPLKSKSFWNYLLSNLLNYLTFILILSIYNKSFNLYSFIISLIINVIFIIISYNYLKRRIKLVRWL